HRSKLPSVGARSARPSSSPHRALPVGFVGNRSRGECCAPLKHQPNGAISAGHGVHRSDSKSAGPPGVAAHPASALQQDHPSNDAGPHLSAALPHPSLGMGSIAPLPQTPPAPARRPALSSIAPLFSLTSASLRLR